MNFQLGKSIARREIKCVWTLEWPGVPGLLVSCDFEHVILCASYIKWKQRGRSDGSAVRSTHCSCSGPDGLPVSMLLSLQQPLTLAQEHQQPLSAFRGICAHVSVCVHMLLHTHD